jgi:hypothetical protein
MKKVYLFALMGAMSAIVAFNACKKDKGNDSPAAQGKSDVQAFATCVKAAGGVLATAEANCLGKIDWEKIRCENSQPNRTDEYTQTVEKELVDAATSFGIEGDVTTGGLLTVMRGKMCITYASAGIQYEGKNGTGDNDGTSGDNLPNGISISADGKLTITARVENGATYNINEVKAGFWLDKNTYAVLASGTYANGGFTLTLPTDVNKYLEPFEEKKGLTITPADVNTVTIGIDAYNNKSDVGDIAYQNADGSAQAIFLYADKAATMKGTVEDITFNLTLKQGWNIIYETVTCTSEYNCTAMESNTAQSGLKWVYGESLPGEIIDLENTVWCGQGKSETIIFSTKSSVTFMFNSGTYTTLPGNKITITYYIGKTTKTITGTFNGNQMTLTIDGETVVFNKVSSSDDTLTPDGNENTSDDNPLIGTVWKMQGGDDNQILSFTSNHQVTFYEQGTYTLSGNKITIIFYYDDGNLTITGTINGNQMTLTADGETVVFNKVSGS